MKIDRRHWLKAAGALGLGAAALEAGAQATAGRSVPPAAPGTNALPVIRPGKTHRIESANETVRVGILDPKAAPIASIDSGDLVKYPNTWVNWANGAEYGMSYEDREPVRKRFPQGPYSNIGPVEVRGAMPGDVVECRMVKLRPIGWGWNSAPKGVGALPSDFSKPYLRYFKFEENRQYTEFAPGIRIKLAPFQGVMAVQPAGDEPVSGILSGPYGGNLVLRELVEGTSLFLPVQRPGAMVWTGDSHAAQGDGVVNQTAIETAMEDMQIQYILHKQRPLALPMAETPSHWIILGFGKNLDEALVASLRQMLDWVSAATGMDRQDVYSLASITSNFRITQYSNQTNSNYTSIPAKTVHGMLPKAIFDAAIQEKLSRSLRG
ncbi:acetamidase/formamidase family protein [Cupriavidus sp. 2TAF22]|uniref:acetamidase/formamidase family protein n=1 Tax=unclassified Cupriavidus TaxID=2640874 RepID=UPI003F8DEB06